MNTVTTFTKRENDVLPVVLLKENVHLKSFLQRVPDALSCCASSSVSQTMGIQVLVSSNRLMYFSVVLRVLSLCPLLHFFATKFYVF